MDTFALNLLITSLIIKDWTTSLVHFTTLLLIKKSEESVIKSAGAPNQHLADELNKPIIP